MLLLSIGVLGNAFADKSVTVKTCMVIHQPSVNGHCAMVQLIDGSGTTQWFNFGKIESASEEQRLAIKMKYSSALTAMANGSKVLIDQNDWDAAAAGGNWLDHSCRKFAVYAHGY
jgi:hypothetical protein